MTSQSQTQNLTKKKNILKSGVQCSVLSCKKSRRTCPNLKLFKFPPADMILGQIWREKCKIPLENYEKNLFICNKHFSSAYIGKKLLKKEAIPTLYLEETDFDMDVVESIENKEEESVCAKYICSNCEKQVKACQFYQKKYFALKKKFNRTLSLYKNSRCPKNRKVLHKTKNKVRSVINSIKNLNNIEPYAKTFCTLLLSDRPKEYSEDVQNLAINIYFISPRTYLFLRNKLKLNLPHETTLNRWAPIKNLQPGFINSSLNFLKKKISELKDVDKQHAVLLMDEMKIRNELKYNTKLDLIDGFEFDGFERTNKIGGQVCVFLLKGLFSNWSIVFNYFVSQNGLASEKLSSIVKENLKILFNLDIKIRALVCDQGSANRKCFSMLGVTTENPYFIYEKTKIFCMYDFPHLLKSLRNNWLQSDLKTPDGIVSFKVLQELWDIEQGGKTKMCLKLTRQHIFPNSFEKMRVKFATQIFSKTVQAAIKTINDTIGFKTCSKETAKCTAEFILKIDKLFDCMNSASLYSANKYKCALQLGNEPYEFIKKSIDYLKEVQYTDSRKRVFCLDGLKLSLTAVLLLVNECLNENSNMFYIMTKSINQDRLENTFAILRQKGGHNNNPSIFELNNLLARIITTKIIQASSSSNCDVNQEIEEFIPEELLLGKLEEESPTETLLDFGSEIYADSFLKDVFENSQNLDVELFSMRYFIGYVAFKTLQKLDCEQCKIISKKEDEVLTSPSEMFIFHKNYKVASDFGNLVAPSDVFLDICKKHITIFNQIFQTNPQLVNIKKIIITHCKEGTPDWFQGECQEHRNIILEFMITVLLRKHCSWATSKGGSCKRKLKILEKI